MAARALDFLVCGAINEPRLPADGSISNQFFCVRCDQRTCATRKHELLECPGNRLINHAHMKESDHFVTLAQAFWDIDQVFIARGLLPRVTGYLRLNLQNVRRSECGKAGVSRRVPVTRFWSPLTALEAVAKLPNL